MAYEEPANPLTGKGSRHTASALSTLGLSKSVIVEPEPEIEEPKHTSLKKGTLLVNKKHINWGIFRVTKENQDGYYEIDGDRGGRVLYENELDEWEVTTSDRAKTINAEIELDFEIITKQDNFGGELKYLNMGLVKGRNFLKRAGYIHQPNPLYMKKGDEYFHYNKTSGIWIYEKVKT